MLVRFYIVAAFFKRGIHNYFVTVTYQCIQSTWRNDPILNVTIQVGRCPERNALGMLKTEDCQEKREYVAR